MNATSEGVLARKVSLDVFRDVTSGGAYLNLRLKSARAVLSERDASFMTALVHTVLDKLYTIDSVLDKVVAKKPKPVIRDILRLATAELLFMRTPTYAVAGTYTALTGAIGKKALTGFVNGVIRALAREKENLSPVAEDTSASLSVRYSCPEWIVSMWINDYGREHTIALLQSDSSPLTVRAQYPYSADKLISELPVNSIRGTLDSEAIYLDRGFDITGSSLFREGKMTVQGEGAMLLTRALGNPEGLKVLDACAAPGGKSAYLASIAKNNVDLTCFELHEHRLTVMNNTFKRLGVTANTILQDASEFNEAYENAFDAVLLDVPCSGLGLIHDKPDIRYRKTPEDVKKLTDIQWKILSVCSKYVRPGGILVYATCTISKAENELMVDRFLSENPSFTPAPLPFYRDSRLQLFPDIHGTDGFFVARMKRCI